MRPANPAALRFRMTARPGEVGRGLAPTTATERGEKSRSSRYVDMLSATVLQLQNECSGYDRSGRLRILSFFACNYQEKTGADSKLASAKCNNPWLRQ